MSSESRHPALTFDDVQIRQLFGSEDAENEDSARFKEYFVRNRAYENLVADLPLRILVGHKGVGKSALLRHAYKIDFVVARFDRDGHIEWRFFDQSRFLAHEHADFGNAWEVHPAYRWALQPNDVQTVINTISLPN